MNIISIILLEDLLARKRLNIIKNIEPTTDLINEKSTIFLLISKELTNDEKNKQIIRDQYTFLKYNTTQQKARETEPRINCKRQSIIVELPEKPKT